ncbi:MAG TPA: DUF192 domain-containing protein [Thermoleophilaceae bacterium]|nr:DUF192 domain-containing protein [Thermoleophilaceae bacterium]
MLHERLRGLPVDQVADNATVLHARTIRARLLGLAWMAPTQLPSGHALLLRPCSSVHTFGMRFPVDVAFADSDGTVLRVIRGVTPRRVRRCPKAAVTLEAHAGELGRFLVDGRGAGSRLAIPLEP